MNTLRKIVLAIAVVLMLMPSMKVVAMEVNPDNPDFLTGNRISSNYRDYNYYDGWECSSWKEAQELIKRDNLILVNSPDYPQWEEIYARFHDEDEQFADVIQSNYFPEGERYLMYTTQEKVDEFLSYEPDNEWYYMSKYEFMKSWLYVYERVLEEYLEDDGEFVFDDTLNMATEEWGTIVVIGNLPKEVMNKELDMNTEAGITFQNIETGRIYSFGLNPWADMTTAENVPVGEYTVYSAFYSSEYPATVYVEGEGEIEQDSNIIFTTDKEKSVARESIVVRPYTSQTIMVNFGEPLTVEEFKEQKEATTTSVSDNTKEENEDIQTVDIIEEPIEEKKDGSVSRVILVVLGIVGLGCIIGVCAWIGKTKKKNSSM